MIKIRILEKKINAGKPIGFVPCPNNKFKLIMPVACQMNCDKFSGIDAGYLLCGQPGANHPLPQPRRQRSLQAVLRSYGEDDRGASV